MEKRAVRGMHDIFGDEITLWVAVENKMKEILGFFGYREIRTPMVEKIEVFSETIGDATDIVEKQMYRIEAEDGVMVLRPEGTAPFVRAVMEHGLFAKGSAERYFYSGPMFRHERPQKGRLRQFHQIGAEIINDNTPESDAELITLLQHLFQGVGIINFTTRINSVGCATCRPVYKEKLRAFLQPQLNELCPECQKRFERSALRILDCKVPACKATVAPAPKAVDCLCEECRLHHERLKQCLGLIGVKAIDDPTIVRGLDYYMRTAFEITSDDLGAQNALGGGGRYDGVSLRFGKQNVPAVGFALGMERVLIAVKAAQVATPKSTSPQYFFAPVGEKAFSYLFQLSFSMKRKGICVEMLYDKEKSLKALLKVADRTQAAFTVILGDNEIAANKALIKEMSSHQQEETALASLEETLLRKVSRET